EYHRRQIPDRISERRASRDVASDTSGQHPVFARWLRAKQWSCLQRRVRGAIRRDDRPRASRAIGHRLGDRKDRPAERATGWRAAVQAKSDPEGGMVAPAATWQPRGLLQAA